MWNIQHIQVIDDHIVFIQKYRRKVIYKELKQGIEAILRKICNELKVEIIEVCSDHIHITHFFVHKKSSQSYGLTA